MRQKILVNSIFCHPSYWFVPLDLKSFAKSTWSLQLIAGGGMQVHIEPDQLEAVL